jgi:hypothetical protein
MSRGQKKQLTTSKGQYNTSLKASSFAKHPVYAASPAAGALMQDV